MAYAEEDYLQISGIQHFAFCRRRWALIHIEGQWAENARTVGGTIFHERAHDAGLSEKRGDLLTVRGLRVFSAMLGISGECDVVEFRLQLCLEAMCLEEMLGCRIDSGYLYYGEVRRREPVAIDAALRDTACAAAREMHAYMRRGYAPRVKTGRFCRACSMKDICLPALCKDREVSAYIRETIGEGDA